MLPVILGAAAAALLLGGCSKEEEKSSSAKPSPPPNSKSAQRQAPPVPYKKSCLDDLGCSAEQQLAAAQDYTVTIYGPPGASAFDGIFRPAEKKLAVSQWGQAQNPKDITGLLDRAHAGYLSQHADPNNPLYCTMASLYHFMRAENKSGNQAAALLGPHQCGRQYATLFGHSGIETEIAAQQEDWIFFIESSRQQERFEKRGVTPVEESALFSQVAKGLGIPVINPLVPLDDSAVATAMKVHGVSPQDYAVVLAVARINDAFPATAEQQQDLEALNPKEQIKTRLALLQVYFAKPDPRNFNANDLAMLFNIPTEKFYAACLALVTPKPGDDPMAFFTTLKKYLSQTADQAIAISNDLSIKRVKSQLQQHSRPKAFFQMGADHQPILQGVYGPTREIPLKNVLGNK